MKTLTYKIVVLGDVGCGKSALVKRFVRNETVSTYDPTVEDKYEKKFEFRGNPVMLEIVDTSGKELLPDMLNRYIAFADAFVVCYSIASRKSFERAFDLFQLISQRRNVSQIARVLVGCKCDSSIREICSNEANNLSAHLQCSFAETSATHTLNINEVFDECISQLNYINLLRSNNSPQYHQTNGSNWCCFL